MYLILGTISYLILGTILNPCQKAPTFSFMVSIIHQFSFFNNSPNPLQNPCLKASTFSLYLIIFVAFIAFNPMIMLKGSSDLYNLIFCNMTKSSFTYCGYLRCLICHRMWFTHKPMASLVRMWDSLRDDKFEVLLAVSLTVFEIQPTLMLSHAPVWKYYHVCGLVPSFRWKWQIHPTWVCILFIPSNRDKTKTIFWVCPNRP